MLPKQALRAFKLFRFPAQAKTDLNRSRPTHRIGVPPRISPFHVLGLCLRAGGLKIQAALFNVGPMISLASQMRLLPLLAGGALLLGGCLPAAHTQLDEEKEYHFLAGKSRINGMDYPGAIESFQKALENNPHSASAHFELGWLYDQKESDPAAAIYHYERYLKLRKNADNAEMVRTRIMACKQELARTVSLGPVTQTLQRTLEQLAEENRVLKESCAFYSNRLALVSAQSTPLPQAAEASASSRSSAPSGVTVAVMTQPGGSRTQPSSSSRSTGAAPSQPSSSPTLRSHTVKSGETLTTIARRYNVKLSALMDANPRLDPRRMRVGQVINIPASGT